MIVLTDKADIDQFLTEWQKAPLDGDYHLGATAPDNAGYPSIKSGYLVKPHPVTFQACLVHEASDKAIPLSPVEVIDISA